MLWEPVMSCNDLHRPKPFMQQNTNTRSNPTPGGKKKQKNNKNTLHMEKKKHTTKEQMMSSLVTWPTLQI